MKTSLCHLICVKYYDNLKAPLQGFVMLTLEEIGQSVRNNLQLIIDSSGLKLAVGPIKDEDYKILCGGYGELEWDIGLNQYGNDPDRFEFCVKLLTSVVESVPSGIALCVYGIKDKVFKVHMIERFFRHNDDDHPLKGRMVTLTLMAAFLFCKAVNAKAVHIVEPVKELVEYYATYGFVMHKCGDLMVANVDSLTKAFETFAQKQ